MRVALYGAYAADVNLDSSALKDAGVDCSTTFDGNEFQSPTVRTLSVIFSRTLLIRYVRLMARTNRLLDSVTLLHLRQRLFGNISAPPNSSGIPTVCHHIISSYHLDLLRRHSSNVQQRRTIK